MCAAQRNVGITHNVSMYAAQRDVGITQRKCVCGTEGCRNNTQRKCVCSTEGCRNNTTYKEITGNRIVPHNIKGYTDITWRTGLALLKPCSCHAVESRVHAVQFKAMFMPCS